MDIYFVSKSNKYLLKEISKFKEELMAAIDNLNDAVSNLQTKVDVAVKKISDLEAQIAAGSNDAQIQINADAVNAASQKLSDASA